MISQFVANAVFASASYTLVGIGFLVVYKTRRVFDFSYAALYAVAPYLALLGCRNWGLPLVAGIIIGIFSPLLVALVFEKVVFHPMRQKGASLLVLMLASLGLLVLTQNILSISFGDIARTLRPWSATEGLHFIGARLTEMQAATILCSIVLVIAVSLLLHLTSMGKAMRAVSSDKQLAWISGVNVHRTFLQSYLLGALFASISAILIAIDTDLTPTMGMPALLIAVIVCVVGGMSSVFGTVVAAIIVGFGQQAAIWVIGSQWQDAIAFCILLVFLLVRPEGVMGKKLRKATV